MIKVGLTGGVCSGKTTVSQFLEKTFHVPVVDADEINHEIQKQDDTIQEICELFGSEIKDRTGEIDRKKLGLIVFNDSEARKKLEAILHPRILRVMGERMDLLAAQGKPIAIASVALLIETSMAKTFVDLVLLVTSDQTIRRQRLVARGLSSEDAEKLMQAQQSDEEKTKFADYVLENNGTLEALYLNTEKLWETICADHQISRRFVT